MFKALVLSDDHHHSSAKLMTWLMISQYRLLWPRAPFRFYVPFNKDEANASRVFAEFAGVVKLVRVGAGIAETMLGLLKLCGRDEVVFYCIDDKYPIALRAEALQNVLPWVMRQASTPDFGSLALGFHRSLTANLVRDQPFFVRENASSPTAPRSLVAATQARTVAAQREACPCVRATNDTDGPNRESAVLGTPVALVSSNPEFWVKEFWSHQFIRAELLRAVYTRHRDRTQQADNVGKALDNEQVLNVIRGFGRRGYRQYVVAMNAVVFAEASHRQHLLPNAFRAIEAFAARRPGYVWQLSSRLLPARGTEIFLRRYIEGPCLAVRRVPPRRLRQKHRTSCRRATGFCRIRT